MNEEERDNIIREIVENGEWNQNPNLIAYMTKKNKVYPIEKIEDVLEYNKYCIGKILQQEGISLEEARSNLLNSLVNIDVINKDYCKEIEENVIDELYYYNKYSSSETGEISQAIQSIIEIMDTATIKDFKTKLQEKHADIENFNFNTVVENSKQELKEISRKNIIEELNYTQEMLNNTKNVNLAHEGENIPIKKLDGQRFTLAITTVMPHCSGIRRKLKLEKDDIIDNMLNRPLNPNNRCTSLINDKMIAHAMSEIQDNELKYAYIPENPSQISICGKHDLSTKNKQDEYGEKHRVSYRSLQNRKANDLIDTTTEEHNEVVLDKVYPRYIVCFDRVSEIAVKKYKKLKEQYEQEGIEQKIEILLIEGKNKYIPQIEEQLEKNMNDVKKEMQETSTLSEETINKYFNKRERNLMLQTIQAINCTSYQDELWNIDENKQKMNQLINILEESSKLLPKDDIGKIDELVAFLLQKANRNSIYRKRFYDHSYVPTINEEKLIKIQEFIQSRLSGEEKNEEKESSRLR